MATPASFPTQSNVQAALKAFLVAVLPADVDVILAQPNRVPEPSKPNFVIMTPLRFQRLRTNVDAYGDVKFTGAIAGGTLTISDLAFGTVRVGATVFGSGVAAGTTITALGTGTGGVGTYRVSRTQTVPSRELACGAKTIEQGAMVTIQLDFHSATDTDAGDMAMIVSTLMRDPYGVEQFANQSPNYGVVPLYADDPVQRPFINENQQYEWRWVLEAILQANIVVTIPQQFADSVDVEVISVDASYPP